MGSDNEYMRKYMLERYYRRKQEYMELLGGVCVECGSTANLEFHHRETEDKLYTLGRVLSSLSKEKADVEVAKCDLLCGECHKLKHRAPHGTISRYRDCRCDLCREAWNAHSREYKRKRRLSRLEYARPLTDETLVRFQ